jgi:hypothetical protein
MWKAWVALVCLLGASSAWARPRPVSIVSAPEEEDSLTFEHPLTVQLQGGVEGYTGPLAPRIDVGVTYGLSIAYEPTRFLGFELGYSGAVNELRPGPTQLDDPNPRGPDLIRNGGYLIVTPGYSFQLPSAKTSFFKPYALGGIGLDRYDFRGRTAQLGYTDQTVPSVPFGAGLKARMGQFSADARVDYAWQFDRRFTLFDDHPMRFQGQVLVGATF